MKKSCRSVYISFFGVYLYFLNIFLSLPRERERKMYTWQITFSSCFHTFLHSSHDISTHTRSQSRSSTFVHLCIRSFSHECFFTYLREYLSVARYTIIPPHSLLYVHVSSRSVHLRRDSTFRSIVP